jgi:hypothetical protein
MSCSPVDVVMGRLFPSTSRASMALMVVPSRQVPAQVPAQDGMAMPSKDGKEGIVGTGMSRRPVGTCVSRCPVGTGVSRRPKANC